MVIQQYWYKIIFLYSILIISACTKVNLPPVPANRPYQSAIFTGSSDHGHGNLTVAIPENRPPYFNGMHGNGIERDIIHESFIASGLHPEFMITSERNKKFDAGRFGIECVATVNPDFKFNSEIYFSETVVNYHYTPFILKKSDIVINNYNDMSGKIVESSTSAELYLGSDFSNMIPKMLIHSKHVNRISQIILLLNNHVDVLIMDRLMFNFALKYLRQLRPVDYSAEIIEVPVEKVIEFKLGCHKQAVIHEFNKGLAILKANHSYDEIFKQYLTE